MPEDALRSDDICDNTEYGTHSIKEGGCVAKLDWTE